MTSSLLELQRTAEQLSRKDRESLLVHLVHTMDDMPPGCDDEEAALRDKELESGRVAALSHEEFVKHVRSGE